MNGPADVIKNLGFVATLSGAKHGNEPIWERYEYGSNI